MPRGMWGYAVASPNTVSEMMARGLDWRGEEGIVSL